MAGESSRTATWRSYLLGAISLGSASCEFARPAVLTDDACSGSAACAPVDAPGTTSPDAATTCDPTGAFDGPVALVGFTMGLDQHAPRLSSDELAIYFDDTASVAVTGPTRAAAQPLGIGVHPDDVFPSSLYVAQRSSVDQPFGRATLLPNVNLVSNEINPSVTGDGLTLFFEYPRTASEGSRVYAATRASRIVDFNAPSKVANVNSTDVTASDAQPSVTADGQELWFTSTRAGGLGGYDIYRARSNGGSFVNAAGVLELNTTANDWLPTLSADKLTVYFSSDRPNGNGGLDIWTAHRSAASDGFPPPTRVPELSSSADDLVGWVSPDNCRLYFSSNSTGRYQLYVATRHPR